MNYVRSDVEKILLDISENIEYYEATGIENRKSLVFLANGDKINYNVPKNSIAHLLGINTAYLISTGIFKEKDSYKILKKMCDEEYYLWNNISKGVVDPNKLFSKHIKKKLEIFKENIKINTYKSEFVCKYKKERTYGLDVDENDYDYIICQKNDENDFMLLGLANNNGKSVPQTSQFFNEINEFKNCLNQLIKNQDLTFITGISLRNNTIDYEKNFNMSNDTKILKFKTLKRYSKKFNSTIDVTKEYEYILEKKLETSKNYFESKQYYNKVSECISNNKIITEKDLGIKDFLELDEELINIVEAFNDVHFNIDTAKETNVTYSKLIKDLKLLKADLLKAKDDNSYLLNQNRELEEKNEELETKLKLKNEDINKVNEYVKKIGQITNR